MSESEQKSMKFWDRTAKSYDSQLEEEDDVAIFTLERCRKHLQPRDVVLDFGCATGGYALAIAPSVEEVWGIDFSKEMINVAKGNAEKKGILNATFIQAEISNPQLKEQHFNAILAANILHLVNNPKQVVVRINHLLKPGGIFISVTPCLGTGRSLSTAIIKLSGRLGIVPKAHVFKGEDVETLVRQAQFDLLETQLLQGQQPLIYIAARRRLS